MQQLKIMVKIQQITDDKKKYLDLLLLADEQESMIDRYLEPGEMFVLSDEDVKSVCVLLPVDDEVIELKNLATDPKYQRRGYAKTLLEFVFAHYKGRYKTILVGTGEIQEIIGFYERFGFVPSHRIKNFFTDHVDHAIYENGIQLVDMIYLRKDF